MGRIRGQLRERGDRRKVLLDLLRQIRREAGLGQVELARRLGKPQSFVSKYESGERRLDPLDLQEVCEAVGISLEGFAGRFDKACRQAVKTSPTTAKRE